MLRRFYYRVIVRFVVMIVLGLNIRHRKRLPHKGPAIIVANHNSHLDTMVLMSLFHPKLLPKVQPVAALDYFLKNRFMAWFAMNIVGILPIQRKGADDDPLEPVYLALDREQILIFFPEGSRGEPEQMIEFKGGIAKLAEKYPGMPVTPVFLHGLGKALPKGEALLVPFFCDVFIGEPVYWHDDRSVYLRDLDKRIHKLADEGTFADWK